MRERKRMKPEKGARGRRRVNEGRNKGKGEKQRKRGQYDKGKGECIRSRGNSEGKGREWETKEREARKAWEEMGN